MPSRFIRSSMNILTYTVLLAGSVLALAPLFWGFLTTLKTDTAISIYPPQWFPHQFSLEHYRALWSRGGIPRFFLNSLIFSLGTIFVSLAAATPAAYAASRFRFWGKNAVLLTILATSMIPGICILIPIYLLAIKVNLVNNFAFIIIVYSAWQIPQTIWLIRGFVESVPREIEEAALIDGCSTLQTLYRVTMPLIQPGYAAISILIFIFVWNDFLIGRTLTIDEDMRTIQVGLVRILQDQRGISWGEFMALTILAVAPVLLAFVLLEKRFVEGLTTGALKG
jgi:multiple sugar transport system permease protein